MNARKKTTRVLHMGCGEPLGCRLRVLLPWRPETALVLNRRPPLRQRRGCLR